MRGVALAWLTFITLQTVQYEKAHPATLPPPSVYVGAAMAFGILGGLAQPAPGPANAMAWALIVAAGIKNQFQSTGPNPLGTKPAATPPARAKTVKGN